MKAEFEEYLNDIQAGVATISAVEDGLAALQSLCPTPIDRIFLCDKVDESGDREFQSLWGFSGTFVLELQPATEEEKFDMIDISRSVTWIKVTKQSYELDSRRTSARSRLALEARFSQVINGHFSATSRNCRYLAEVIHEMLIPNMVPTAT